jgi:hypothetical protein
MRRRGDGRDELTTIAILDSDASIYVVATCVATLAYAIWFFYCCRMNPPKNNSTECILVDVAPFFEYFSTSSSSVLSVPCACYPVRDATRTR